MEVIKKELNPHNEHIYNLYFNKNICFTWMKPEDIKYTQTSSSSKSPFYFEQLICNKTFLNYDFEFLGFNIKYSNEWKGRTTSIVIKLDNVLYIRDMKAFLEMPNILLNVPHVSHNINNIEYYLNKYNENIKYIKCSSFKINDRTELFLQCKLCGYVYNSCLHNIKHRNTNCPDCMNNVILSEDDMSYRIKLKLYNQPHIKLLNFNYNSGGNKNAIGTYHCSIHNHTWDAMYFSTIPKDQSCKFCMDNQSKGEMYISEILDSLNVLYHRQHRFDMCFNKRKLPFDFYLPDYNICIEFDGKQHFKSIDFFGGETEFKKRQINDGIKNSFCEKNNINLLRIDVLDYSKIKSLLFSKIKDVPHYKP